MLRSASSRERRSTALADPLRRLATILLPVSVAQVVLAVLTAVVVPGLDVPSSAAAGLIAGEATLAVGLICLLIALRRRARQLTLAERTVTTTRNGGRP